MRLAFVNTIPLWGGGEKWTLGTAEEFRRRGHDVSVLAVDGGELLKRAQAAGLETVAVPADWLPRWRFLASVRSQYEASPPDLLIANCGKDVRVANRVRPSSRSIPLLFRRGLDKPIAGHLLHRQAFGKVQALLANSYATRATLRSSFPWFPEDRIFVIYNPVRLDEFHAYPPRDVRKELGLSSQAFVVGVIGRLARQKGHEVLLRAFPRILSARPDAAALFVGAGELEEELRSLVARSGLAKTIHFVGQAELVQPYYEACDVVAIPSLYEGFCFVALEAQLMGRPVVASQTSSLPEIVEDGVTGFLVPVGDAGALADRIVRLGADPALRQTLAETGRQRAKERFDASRIYDELETLFIRVAREKSRPR